MGIESQISICTEHYKKWKDIALSTGDRNAIEKAFFWLELQSAFMALFTIEQTRGNDLKVKKSLIIAKTNLSKKLAEYANEIIRDIK